MNELLTFIAKSLVEYPDEVQVTEKETDTALIFELHVADSDMGKVIGKQGKIAKAIRTIVRSSSKPAQKRIVIDITQKNDE